MKKERWLFPCISLLFAQGFFKALLLPINSSPNSSSTKVQSYLQQLLQNTALPSQTRLFICLIHFSLCNTYSFFKDQFKRHLATFDMHAVFPNSSLSSRLPQSEFNFQFMQHVWIPFLWHYLHHKGKGIYVPVLPLLLPSSLLSPSPATLCAIRERFGFLIFVKHTNTVSSTIIKVTLKDPIRNNYLALEDTREKRVDTLKKKKTKKEKKNGTRDSNATGKLFYSVLLI